MNFSPIFVFTLQQTNADVTKIVMQRLIKVDGKVRTDSNFPAGFMDVITIEKTGEHFRLIYDVKGRFTIHRISAEEAKVSKPKIWFRITFTNVSTNTSDSICVVFFLLLFLLKCAVQVVQSQESTIGC